MKSSPKKRGRCSTNFTSINFPHNISGQIIIFHQPEFPWNKGNSLAKPPLGVRSCEVAIIWPEHYKKTISPTPENLELSTPPPPSKTSIFVFYYQLPKFTNFSKFQPFSKKHVRHPLLPQCHKTPASVVAWASWWVATCFANSSLPQPWRIHGVWTVAQKTHMSHEKTRGPSLSIESWLVNRDPYNALLQSLYNWVV